MDPQVVITHFYAQFLGIYLLVTSLALIINPSKARHILNEAKASRALVFFDGSIAVLLGTLFILTLNLGSNSLAAIIIKFYAWFMFVAGVFELMLPHEAMKKILSNCKFAKHAYFVILSIILLTSIYLLLYGFGVVNF